MNSDRDHIDAEQLKKYYEGLLSEQDKNALEQLALDDPFLKSAMEGFEADPGSFEHFYHQHQLKYRRFGRAYFLVGAILTVGLLSLLLLHNLGPDTVTEEPVADITGKTDVRTTVDVIPEAIDSLEPIPESEAIKAQEIVTNKTEIQKSVPYTVKPGERPIVIEEDVSIDEDFKIIEEDRQFNLAEYVPATYLFDLFVVDYRRIKRERQDIIYSRYEFSGTSAQFESEESQHRAELIERQVEVPYFDYLRTMMEHFSRDNYKKALAGYQVILEQYPDDLNAHFYGGLCYYNLRQYERSIASFDRVLGSELNAFREEAKWYKARALIRIGRKTEARLLLEEIIAGGGFYTREAIDLEKTL